MSVPLLEALELPITVERTTQKPHAEYVYQRKGVTLSRRQSSVYTLLIGIYRCLILDSNLKFSRFQAAKKERQINAFKICSYRRTTSASLQIPTCSSPRPGLPQVGLHLQSYKLFSDLQSFFVEIWIRYIISLNLLCNIKIKLV